MDYLQTAKKALDELTTRCSCTSVHGIGKQEARHLRVRISREAQRRGMTVFTKLLGREMTIWRVE